MDKTPKKTDALTDVVLILMVFGSAILPRKSKKSSSEKR